MRSSPSLKSDVTYMKNLLEAVAKGIASAREETATQASPPLFTNALWKPAALGAAIGILSASAGRRSGYRMAVGGLVGCTLGLGTAVAWRSRRLTTAAARSAVQKVNQVRDARWLQKNPIAYA